MGLSGTRGQRPGELSAVSETEETKDFGGGEAEEGALPKGVLHLRGIGCPQSFGSHCSASAETEKMPLAH